MITARSDSSDRYVTVSISLRSLLKTLPDLRNSRSSDSSDRKSRVPPRTHATPFNARNPPIGHCGHYKHCTPHLGSNP